MNSMQMAPPPGGDIWGTIVVVAGVIITVYSFVFAFRATCWPGETNDDHPKNIIFKRGY